MTAPRRPVADLLAAAPDSVLAVDGPAAAAPAPAARTSPLRPGGRHGVLTGALWAGFEIGDLLGSGGMGEVYLAREPDLDRLVAVKVMAPGLAADPALRRRWGNEARALAGIDSPHVVRVLTMGEAAERPYLAMELLDGGTLAQAIAEHRLSGRPHPPLVALDLVLQAARGLAAAHAAGLVHRDIKPGNLMFDAGGRLKLVDFGLVRFTAEAPLTMAGYTVGTPQYMAPEQGRGETTDARSDLYALGCVLYELLTGTPPFSADSPEAMVFQHGFAEPELPSRRTPGLPADLEAVCIKCLQKDPARRYPDAAQLIADLERLRAGLAPLSALFPPGQLGTGADEALRRLGLRRRWWPLAAAAALVLALAGAWWWRDARQGEEAQVRERLAPLAHAVAPPGTAAADLDRLARLAGADDPQVRQGRERLAELAALHAGLAGLEADAGSPAARHQAEALLGRLEVATGGSDPALAPWRARLAAAAARIAALRQALAPLDQDAAPTAARRGEATRQLAELAGLAGDDDRDLQRWRAIIAAAETEEERLRSRCTRLDDPAPLTAAALAELASAHRRLRQLAAEGTLPTAWDERLTEEERRLTARRERLARALAAAGDDDHATAEAVAAAADLAAGLALDPADERRVEERQRGQAARRAALAAHRTALANRLAALDTPRSLAAGVDADLAAYEAIAGLADADAQRWRTRLARVRLLQGRLEPLTRAATPPAGAAADLAALAELVGADDPLVRDGQSRLTAIAGRRAALAAALDRIAPIPTDSGTQLAAYARLVGEDDADVRRWRAKLATWAAAAGRLAPLERAWVLDPDALAAAERALADAHATVGPAAVLPWARRLAALRGPAAPAWAAAHGRDRHGPWVTLRIDAAEARLRWRPPGTIAIGSPPDEAGREGDEARVRVRLDAGQWIGESECTQALWQAVMGGKPSRFGDPARPVEQVDQAAAMAFCRRLEQRLPGSRVRLPSEAEWEAAARGGLDGPWPGLDRDQAAAAIVHQGRGLGPAPTGGRAANPLGLQDILGNVWEWCAGGYGPQPVGDPAVDPQPPAGALAPLRGGSWADPLATCRAANRCGVDPRTASPQVGFRFAIDPDETASP